jgi:hypothetical protein
VTRITDEFGITGVVDFLDVHIERDNLLYIDPSAIRKAVARGDRYAILADAALTQYFDKVLARLVSAVPAEHLLGEKSLQHFNELGATRLGMSYAGYKGHGAAEKLGTQIWNELLKNPLCRLAIATLKYIEDVPLFVGGIDKDITSDMTTRVIIDALEQFTSDMMIKHPELTIKRPVAHLRTESWDGASLTWKPKDLVLPVADGNPLLLVPKWLVNFKIQMTYGQYYGVPVLDYIKAEDMVRVKQRKQFVARPRFTKKELKATRKFAPNRQNSIQQTERIFLKDGTDVLGAYRFKQQSNFEPLSDAQLRHYMDIVPKRSKQPMAPKAP